MLRLPDVTLIALTNKDFEGHKKAIDLSCQEIEFGDVKIIWDEGMSSIDDWNYKVIYELPDYVRTSHCLLIHADGYVINPGVWRDSWLAYDYIGAPWPAPSDPVSYRDESGAIVRVGNSVSLRSKRLLELVRLREWKPYYGFTNEDGFICCHNRNWLESEGCTFAPLEEAVHFSKEHEIPENQGVTTFAFHTVDV